MLEELKTNLTQCTSLWIIFFYIYLYLHIYTQTYIYMCLSLWHISVIQTFYVDFAIDFSTNPVFSCDDVNYNISAEMQVCAKNISRLRTRCRHQVAAELCESCVTSQGRFLTRLEKEEHLKHAGCWATTKQYILNSSSIYFRKRSL